MLLINFIKNENMNDQKIKIDESKIEIIISQIKNFNFQMLWEWRWR